MTARRTSFLFVLISVLFGVVTLVAGPAAAQPLDIELGEPIVGGNGCTPGTVRATLTPDKSQVTILFDDYIAESSAERTFVRRTCNVAVPILVPDGVSVTVIKIDARGVARVPREGVDARFEAEYFFAGSSGLPAVQVFQPGYSGNFLTSANITGTLWSECGNDVIARANTSITAESAEDGGNTLIMIDSADVSRGQITYSLRSKECGMID